MIILNCLEILKGISNIEKKIKKKEQEIKRAGVNKLYQQNKDDHLKQIIDEKIKKY